MFTAHLIFGDIDGSSKYDFKQRVEIIEKFQCICFKFKPKRLSLHSFFSIDNDSVMIGFGGQEKLNSGHDVLNYVLELFQELAKHNISVSFGVYLMAIEM